MTHDELQTLYLSCSKRINELEQKYYSGQKMSRTDCLAMRAWTQRLGLVCRELWLLSGQPNDPAFLCLKNPIPRSELPISLRTCRDRNGGH